jgi:hypothetical protein
MQSPGHFLIPVIAGANFRTPRLPAKRPEEFLKVQGIEHEAFNLAHGERVFFPIERDTQKRTRRDEVNIRGFFVKILQRRQRPFTGLYLIKKSRVLLGRIFSPKTPSRRSKIRSGEISSSKNDATR